MEKTVPEIESFSNEKTKIKIQTMDSVFQVEVGNEDCISDLKNKISTQYKIPITHQRLIYQGKLLQDNEKLSYYKITNDCVVHLVARALEENINPNTNTNANESSNNNLLNPNQTQINLNPNQLQQQQQQQEMAYDEIVPVLQIPFRSNRRRRRFLMPHYDVSECFEAIYQNMISIDNLEKCQLPFKGKTPIIEPFDLTKTTYEVGQWVDVKDTIEQWLEAQVIQTRNNSQAYVHYNGWGIRWDEWIDFNSNRMRNFKTNTLQPPASVYMSPYPGIPCDSNIEPQQRSIDAFYYLEKCKAYLDNLSAKLGRMLTLRHKAKEIFEHNYLNEDDQELLFTATQMIPLMDRAGRMMEDISMLMSHLVVNPNLYPQMLLGYKKNELFNKIDIEALKKSKESEEKEKGKGSINPFYEEVIPNIGNGSRSAQMSPHLHLNHNNNSNSHSNINNNDQSENDNDIENNNNVMQEQISTSIAELETNLQQLQLQFNNQTNNSNNNNNNSNINSNSNSSNANQNRIRPQQIFNISHTQPQSPNHTNNINNNNRHSDSNSNSNNNNSNANQSSIQTNLGYNLSSTSNELPFIQRILSSYTQSDRILNPSSHVSNLRDKEAFFPKINLQSPSLLSPGEVMMMTGYYPSTDQNFDIYLHTIVSHPPNGNGDANANANVNSNNGNNNNTSINTNNINANNNNISNINPINMNMNNNIGNDINDHGLDINNQTNNDFNERRISQPTPQISQRINDMLGMSLSETIFGNQIGNGTNMNEGNNSHMNNNPFRSENALYKDEMTQTSMEMYDDKSDSYYSAKSKD